MRDRYEALIRAGLARQRALGLVLPKRLCAGSSMALAKYVGRLHSSVPASRFGQLGERAFDLRSIELLAEAVTQPKRSLILAARLGASASRGA